MRPVQLADIEVAANALKTLPANQRQYALRTLLHEARVADAYRKCLNKPHPEFGTGTLMSAVMKSGIPTRPDRSERGYLDCLQLVVRELRHQYP